ARRPAAGCPLGGPPPAAAPVAAAPSPAAGAFRTVAEAVGAALDRAVHASREAGLETIGLRNGTLEVLRADAAGTVRHVFFEEIVAEGAVDGPAGALDVNLSARGEVGRWSLHLALGDTAGGGRHLVFSADDVTHRDLFGPRGPGFDLGMPFYPRVAFDYDRTGRLVAADLDLKAGAGVFRFGKEPDDEILVDEGQARVVWRPDAAAFEVPQLSVAVGDTIVALKGRVTPPAAGIGPWGLAFALDHGALHPRDVPGEAIPIDVVDVAATFDPRTRFLDLFDGRIRFGSAALQAAGRLDVSGVEPKLKMDLAFSPLTVAQVAHAWPHWVASDARRWFVANVEAGRIADMTIRLDMPRFDQFETWPANAVQVAARFDGVRFRIFGALPTIAGAEGRLGLAERRFEVVVDRGAVATRAVKHPSVDNLRFFVPDVFVKPPKGSITAKVSGEVPALAEIANADPLFVLDQSGVRAEGLAGTASVSTQIDVVFTKLIDPATIEWKVDAQIDRFSNQQPIQGRRFQDGKFRVVADPRGLKVTGRAQIDGVGTDIDLYDPRGAARTGEKREFRMVLDEAARQRMGLDLGGLVQGAVALTVSQPSPTDTRRHIEADLGPARLVLAPFGWTKGSGVPAKATFDQIDDDKGSRIENLTIESEGLSVRGTLQFDKEHKLAGADITKFALRKGDDARFKVTRSGEQTLVVTFDASSFDLRGLMLAQRKPGGGSSADGERGPDINLRLRAARVIGFNDTNLGDVSVDGQIRNGVPTSLQASARASGGRSVTASLKPEGGGRRLVFGSDDAGAVLSFLDLFDRIKGGTLAMQASLPEPGSSAGTVRISDFQLVEEPKSGRPVAPETASDGTRKIPVRRVEIDRSTDFDRASVRFSLHDGVIDVAEGIAKGKSVGATAAGQLDLASQRIALSGTYIPAFGLNNLAGQIPILGAITGAGSNGGLLGVTFRVSGPIEDPILQINPLSAIAPGIFRRIFEFQPEEAGPRGDPNAPTKITP
ncbi:hypothetical protein EYW49_12265, partial [Siculibacillus lacustris]